MSEKLKFMRKLGGNIEVDLDQVRGAEMINGAITELTLEDKETVRVKMQYYKVMEKLGREVEEPKLFKHIRSVSKW